jgi:hypothetical protein
MPVNEPAQNSANGIISQTLIEIFAKGCFGCSGGL